RGCRGPESADQHRGARMKALRPTDGVVLVMAALAIVTLAQKFGVTDPAAIVLLSIGWTCPAANRLIAWRRGQDSGRQTTLENPAGAILWLLVGAAPWVLLPVFQEIHPMSIAAAGDSVSWVRFAGIGLTLSGAATPLVSGWLVHQRLRSKVWPVGQ